MSSFETELEDLSNQVFYFSLRLSSTEAFASAVREAFASAGLEEAKFYQHVRQHDRIQTEFHVTLIHAAQRTTHPGIWEKYKADYKETFRGEDRRDRTPT
jgi:uncharacterized protein YihD (DUF1040 family)